MMIVWQETKNVFFPVRLHTRLAVQRGTRQSEAKIKLDRTTASHFCCLLLFVIFCSALYCK